MYFRGLMKVLQYGIWVSVQRDEEIYYGELNREIERVFGLDRVEYVFPSTREGEPVLVIRLCDED